MSQTRDLYAEQCARLADLQAQCEAIQAQCEAIQAQNWALLNARKAEDEITAPPAAVTYLGNDGFPLYARFTDRGESIDCGNYR